MMKIGKNSAMKRIQDIANVGFNPPSDTHLTVEALSIDILKKRASSEHFEKLQRADFYRLIGVLEGATSPMVDFSTYAARAGDWLLVRPGQVFRYDFSRAWTGWMLVFRPDSLFPAGRGRLANEFDHLRRFEDLPCLHSLNKEQHQWLSDNVQQMNLDGQLNEDKALRNELLRLALAGLLLRLSLWQSPDARAKASQGSGNVDFRRFRKLLDENFISQHQVQHYANALGMSDKTLSRICLAAAGVPAKSLISQRLTLEAKRMLAHTTLSVQAIGQELGFGEATNFVKFFRKKSGMPPLAFRESLRTTSAP
jgi:AraC-like DNA-binding protein